MKKTTKKVIALAGIGVGLGVGASTIEKAGGSVAANVGSGLAAMASFIPPIGATIGAGLTIHQLNKLQKLSKGRAPKNLRR